MNRRVFFATLLAAPLAAVAALKAKPLRVFLNGVEQRDVTNQYTFADATYWSNARSTPIADIQAAMEKIRANVRVQPTRTIASPEWWARYCKLYGSPERWSRYSR